MPDRSFIRVLVLLLAATMLAAGCGGNSDDSDPDKAPASTSDGGYFSESESATLNPAMTAAADARNEFATGLAKCEKEATAMFDAGVATRQAVDCHLTRSQAVVDAVDGISTAIDELDGEWRSQCDEELESFSGSVEELAAAWELVVADWEAYAGGDELDSKTLQGHVDAAVAQGTELDGEATEALSKACYSSEDRAAAGKGEDS